MIDDCWNKIGVRGDSSCPELVTYAHCRNCPVYARAASELLRTAKADDSLDIRARELAEPRAVLSTATESMVIFRIHSEWLALPTAVVQEVANPKPIHSLPHRREGVVLGLTNVRGELLVSASLALMLGLPGPAESKAPAVRASYARVMVLGRDALRVACPVDEVEGVCRLHPSQLKEVPSTLAHAGTRYSIKLARWRDRSVGVLDDELLFYTLRRSVA